ncbi:MAG: hypothetical protein EBQ87_02205 [Planctomycetes bacterium]|nr:hypothetical protein [Planctomycetota bacterium]
MNTLFLLSLSLVALLGAEEPAPATAKPAIKGKVLLLENERVLEGDIELVGDRYKIKRTIGETWLPTNNVVRLCPSMDDAYLFLRSRTNLEDADERLKLVSWCVRYGLKERAVEEATAAVELRPEHSPSIRLLTHLKASIDQDQLRKEINTTVVAEEVPIVLPIEVANDSLSVFATRIQPILMNTCATCHSTGKGGNFKLQRVYGLAKPNQKNLQQNLAAVLSQVNLQQPDNSPFLGKALTLHGGANKAPIKGRETEAYKLLEDWVRMTTVRHAIAQVEVPSSFAEEKVGVKPMKPTPVPPKEKEGEKEANPFDPEVFNKLFNPMK